MGKIAAVAKRIYGAAAVHCERRARIRLKRIADLGFGNLPVCMAKTQYSFSDDKSLMGVPTGWDLTITDAELSAGAGFVVVTAGNMVLMPGLPREPQAVHMGVGDDGEFYGLR
jgi:formate--tetrahydrofolate ligase